MTEFKSKTVSINKNPQSVFLFLSDLSNFGRLMPEQVINWKSTAERCSFTIKGMVDLELKLNTKKEFSEISWVSERDSPLNFTLSTLLKQISETQTEAMVTLNADLNPMIRMMASRPLENLVNILARNLKEAVESPVL